MSSLKDIVGTELLEGFGDKSPVLRGLPACAYRGREYWRRENETLFANAWVFAGFAHAMARPGDAVPVSVAGRPLFLLRDASGEIRAFHNACRHRGLKLIDQHCNVGPRIRCPYHSWVYGLDGKLRSTPHFGGPDRHTLEGFDPSDHPLLAAHCRTWHDWVFVNLSEQPVDFDRYVEPLARRLSAVDLDRLTPVATLDFGEVRANWKLLMENFIEPYHVQFVHAATTDQPLKDHRTVIDGLCLGSAVEISGAAGASRNTLAVDSLYLTLFPNFVLGRYVPDQIGVHLNVPVDVDRTSQQRVIYFSGSGPRDAQEIESLKQLWTRVHGEDHAMCERLQAGKASDAAADGGRLSPHWEDSVRRFQELALQAVA